MTTRLAKMKDTAAAKLKAAEKKDAKKKQKLCITLKILNHPFNHEIESRKKLINAYFFYPVLSIVGTDKEEVNNLIK